jgi:glycosyltransferase involved in cell wall biosynthesis
MSSYNTHLCKFNLDAIRIQNNLIIGHGWIFSEAIEIESVYMVIRDSSRDFSEKFKIRYGHYRQDVHRSNLKIKNSANCGFNFLSSLSRKLSYRAIFYLEVIFVDNSKQYVKIKRTFLYNFYINRFLILINLFRHRKISDLKITFKNIFSYYINIKRKISFNSEEMYSLIVDHKLGGGTNRYSQKVVNDLAKHVNVILISYSLIFFTYKVELFDGKIKKEQEFPELSDLRKFLGNFNINEIILNNCVSYPDPKELIKLILSIRNKNKSKLNVLIHDFYSICPSYNLLNKNNEFCNIPSVSVCNSCLPNNTNSYPYLSNIGKIAEWRSLWGEFLLAADSIIAFSNNSKSILKKSYKSLVSSKIVVIPHELQLSVPKVALNYKPSKTLVIGVLGNIMISKGSIVLERLVDLIKEKKLDIKIVIFGKADRYLDSAVVKQTLTYSHNDLPSLFEKYKPSIFLFPSIWPETFSYVVQELMFYNLPIVAFDIGAPAERLIKYKNAILIKKSSTSSSILMQLIKFHKKINLKKK